MECEANEANELHTKFSIYTEYIKMLHTKLNFTIGDSFCWPTVLECIYYTPWRWPFKDWNMLELFRVLSDDLLIYKYEFDGINLMYTFREFTKSCGVLYLNYVLECHHSNTGPAYQLKYVTTTNPY